MTIRNYWVEMLLRITEPVFAALATDTLRESMPVETTGDVSERAKYTHLEALGRSLAGIAPWLEAECTGEEKLKRDSLLKLVRESLRHASDKKAKDYMNFSEGYQPMVDASLLALGLLRAWNSVWKPLDHEIQKNIIDGMIATRRQTPNFSNWLLFSAMTEAFLAKAGCEWDRMRIDYAIRQHEQWYKGDGVYGDGPSFHWDYYNSFVIQPFLYEIAHVGGEISDRWNEFREPITRRIQRYALIQERFIGPDGTFPPIGRSLAGRFAIFHALALVAFRSILPPEISQSGVRGALTAVMKRLMDRDDIFDANGWLRVGFCGHQPSIGEYYVSTGSLYICLCGFLPLGLPAEASFWADPDADWTSKRIWNGEDQSCDHFIKG